MGSRWRDDLARADRIALYDRVIATVPDLTRKGAKLPYTSVNGNMSSYLADEGGLVLRLGPSGRDAFIQRYHSELHRAYGIVQKEYVDVPDDLFENLEALAPWFRASFAYVASLKPKPTKRAR